MNSADFIATCIALAVENTQGSTFSPANAEFEVLSLNDDSASSISSSPPSSISMAETLFYYSGLYSSPRLVYRTGPTPWAMPTGPEAYRNVKELRPVFRHKINAAWEELGPKVCQLLDNEGLLWTSIDVVRFKVIEEPVGPVVLWIGVVPGTLSYEDARTSANGCLGLLRQFDIADVEVEFRSSIYTRSTGPSLLKPVSNLHPTTGVRGALTPVLAPSIAAWATPHVSGTGGLYLAEGGGSEKVLLVTARHVLFPPNEEFHFDYACKNPNAPRRDIVLLGTRAFDDYIKSIKISIGLHSLTVEFYEQQMDRLQERVDGKDEDDVKEAITELQQTQTLLNGVNKTIEALKMFHDEVKKDWRQIKKRVIGHVVCSPPITFAAGTGGFTEDYAVVELDSAKFKNAFKGNVMDLGMKIPIGEFALKMYPLADAAKPASFHYPVDRLLPLRGIIPEDLMRNTNMLDHDGEACLFVTKNGNTTGVTIGRATGLFSYVREYFSNNTHWTSKEWAILPYDSKSGVFSDRGDSGSIIVDDHGQIGGLLTGGADRTESVDITYATPFFWLLPRIKANGFPNAHLDPKIA